MQQYDHTKRKRKFMLLMSYAAMTLAVLAISTICILLVLGYRFNFSSNRVEQGSLLQFASVPENASIILDGEQLSFNTPGKRDVVVGAHDVTFHREGYRDWKKHVDVTAGEVRWLNYARLVPTTTATEVVKEFESVADELPAPDKQRTVVLTKSNLPVLTLINVQDPKRVTATNLTIPDTVLTRPDGAQHSYSVFEWSDNSRFVLVKHLYGETVEFIRLAVDDPTNIVNLSSKFGVKFVELYFSSENVLYGVENGNIRRFDLASSSLSEPLVKDVSHMTLHGTSDIAYVRHLTNRYEAGIVVDGLQHVLATYDDTTPLQVALGSYFRERYLAITRGASFELIKNPEKSAKDGMKKVVTLSFPSDLKWLDFSPTGRVVIAGNGTQFFSYDIELSKKTDTNFPGIVMEPTRQPEWLDDFMLVSTADSKLRMSDFDGDNQQIITDSVPFRHTFITKNNTYLYSFAKTGSGATALQVTKMILD